MEVGKTGILIVDRHTYVGMEMSKDCDWDAHRDDLIEDGLGYR